MQINKENTNKKNWIIDYDYNFGEKVIPNNKYAYKYETLYIGPFEITQCCTYATVTLKMGVTKNR